MRGRRLNAEGAILQSTPKGASAHDDRVLVLLNDGEDPYVPCWDPEGKVLGEAPQPGALLLIYIKQPPLHPLPARRPPPVLEHNIGAIPHHVGPWRARVPILRHSAAALPLHPHPHTQRHRQLPAIAMATLLPLPLPVPILRVGFGGVDRAADAESCPAAPAPEPERARRVEAGVRPPKCYGLDEGPRTALLPTRAKSSILEAMRHAPRV